MKKSVSLILSFNSDVFEHSSFPRQDDSLASSPSHIYAWIIRTPLTRIARREGTQVVGGDTLWQWKHTTAAVLWAFALELRQKSDEWWWFALGLKFALELWRKSDEWARQALTSSSSPPFRASDTLWLLLLLMIRHKLCSRSKNQRICATVHYNSQCCCLRMFCIDTTWYNPRLGVETVDNSRLAG